MPAYTMRLFDVLKTNPNIGLSKYPIFDESYRHELNEKIVNHYLYWEIGAESIELFVHLVEVRMAEIMPTYNKLYLAELRNLDPFTTINITERVEATREGKDVENNVSEQLATSDTDSASRNVQSEMPQHMLSGTGDYATSASDVNAKTAGKNETKILGDVTRNSEANEDSERHTTGYSGVSVADLLVSYRNSLINIDLMIIRELENLFMGLWNTNDHYTEEGYYGFAFGL